MQKFKKGDKVRIINYGHLGHTTRESFKEQSLAIKTIFMQAEFKLMWEKEMPQEAVKRLIPDEPTYILQETDGLLTIDVSPELVGKEGIIVGSYADLSELNGWGSARDQNSEKTYEISGISEKVAWYDETQLELIN